MEKMIDFYFYSEHRETLKFHYLKKTNKPQTHQTQTVQLTWRTNKITPNVSWKLTCPEIAGVAVWSPGHRFGSQGLTTLLALA